MRNNYFNYLSYRALLLFILLLALTGFLLLLVTAVSINENKFFFIPMIGYALFLAIIYLSYKGIYIPYKETSRVLKLFAGGYTLQDIYDLKYQYSPEMEETIKKIKAIFNTNELISASRKQAHYLALQNQINPHFLYNSLEGIRGEAITAGLDNVAEIAEALGSFFRYIISNVENLVTLEDELANIENYFFIQKYRFGERLNLRIEYDCKDKDEILKCRLPKLTLQPIVENSIFHGLERKIGFGQINIRIESTPKRLIITVSDDGLGMGEERLKELNERLNTQSFDYVKANGDKKVGIGIINVNNRIKLLYGEEYGINIYSTLNVGTDVEITIPRIFEGKGPLNERRSSKTGESDSD